MVIYGSVINGSHVDTSNNLLGAKQYATRHGIDNVSKRTGYVATKVCEKINGKWVNEFKN